MRVLAAMHRLAPPGGQVQDDLQVLIDKYEMGPDQGGDFQVRLERLNRVIESECRLNLPGVTPTD